MKKFLFSIIILILSTTVFSQGKYRPSSTLAERLNNEYCSGLFSTPDGTYFDLLNDNNAVGANAFLNILDWLQGRVAGLQVYSINNNRVAYIRNSPAAIFVDEMRMDAGFLTVLPVTDIAMIKIIKTPFAGAWGLAPAIAIYTKGTEDDDAEQE